jgi:hypothetical protein
MWPFKGAGQKAKKGRTYEITSVEDFKKAVNSVHVNGERAKITDLVLKVGDQLECIGKGGGGWPQFKIGDTVISTNWMMGKKFGECGLKLAR